jgi:putative redox protein
MVQGKRLNDLAAEMLAGRFSIVSGLNASVGGNDEGPNPHELLEASLAACTIMTVQMYAKRKQIKLESTKVAVKVESEGPQGSVISRKVEFLGNLSVDERTRLLEIANKCPIHRLLSGQVQVQTELVGP